MSSAPAVMVHCRGPDGSRNDVLVTSSTITPTPMDPTRTPTSGHRPELDDVVPSSVKNKPNIAPVASARPIRPGVTTRFSSLLPLMLTKPMAQIASTAPIRPSVDGGLPKNKPTTSGITADVTALVGAKIAIAPRDRPR